MRKKILSRSLLSLVCLGTLSQAVGAQPKSGIQVDESLTPLPKQVSSISPKQVVAEIEIIKKMKLSGQQRQAQSRAVSVLIPLVRESATCRSNNDIVTLASLLSTLADTYTLGPGGDRYLEEAEQTKLQAVHLYNRLPAEHPARKRGREEISQWYTRNGFQLQAQKWLNDLPPPLGRNCPACGMG